MELVVAKLGGRPMSSGVEIQRALARVREDKRRRVIVVSAPGSLDGGIKITDELRKGARKALRGESPQDEFGRVAARFQSIEDGLGLRRNTATIVLSTLESRCRIMMDQGRIDPVEALGEELQAGLTAEFLCAQGTDAIALDPTQFLRVREDRYGQAYVSPQDYNRIGDEIRTALASHESVVLPGYYGITEDGRIRTLGRSGTNTTQSVAAAALQADHSVNFTDVDGVRRANPNIIPNASRIDRMSLVELAELSFETTGPVFQGEAVLPLIHAGIPLHILSLEEGSIGTWALPNYVPDPKQPVQGIGYMKNLIAFEIFDPMMADRVGTIETVSRILGEKGISIHNTPSSDRITMAVIVKAESLGTSEEERAATAEELMVEIRRELATSRVTSRHIEDVSVVGMQLYEQAGMGVGARIFSTVARTRVNALYPSGVRTAFTLSVVKGEGELVVRALYAEFFDNEPKPQVRGI